MFTAGNANATTCYKHGAPSMSAQQLPGHGRARPSHLWGCARCDRTVSPRRSQMRFSSPAGPLGKQAALIPVLTQPFSFLLSTKSLGRETKTLFLVPPTTCAPWAGRHSTPFSSSPGITWHWRKAQLGEKLTWLQFGITQVQYLRVAPGGFNNLLRVFSRPEHAQVCGFFQF